MSPRSGTPVKLLGREDASVDWYNLEKSKRVKTFRCGEFDACIERAEASHGIPIKKREKYARREDAILHALELERQQVEVKHQKLGTISNGTCHRNSGAHRRELHSFSSDIYVGDDEPKLHNQFANLKPSMSLRKAVLPDEEENKGTVSYVHKGKNNKHSGWEEYNDESLPRMRGLQDFGLRIASSKKKVFQSTSWEASHEPLDYHLETLSDMGHMIGDAGHFDSSKIPFANKRKRSQGCNGEDYLVKKRDRRRPLVQVLQSSAKLPTSHSFQPDFDSGGILNQGESDHMNSVHQAKSVGCFYLPADSNDSHDGNGYPSEETIPAEAQLDSGNCLTYPGHSSSGLAEETEYDSSETDYLETDIEEDGNLTDTSQPLIPGSRGCESAAVQVSEDFSDLNNELMPVSSNLPPFYLQDQMMDASADTGVSKWHMKGKRNARNLRKRPVDLLDGKILGRADNWNGLTKGATYENIGSSCIKLKRPLYSGQNCGGDGFYHKKELSHFTQDEGSLRETDLGHSQLMGYPNRSFGFDTRWVKDHGRSHGGFNDSENDSHLFFPAGWGADGPSPRISRRAYWEESDDFFDPEYGQLHDEMDSMLIDVEIQVQKRSYQGEHVPWVSLSSKWNGGKPILGHPVQIEILEDGSTAHLVPRYDAGLEENSLPPAFQRTAKRSLMHRIPRPNPGAASALYEDADQFDSDQETKPLFKKAYTGYVNRPGKFIKKSTSHAPRHPVPGKSQKKLSKKASLSNQKTRTLSSLATEQRRGGEGGGLKLSRRSDILGGLIKPEGGIPLVTCVPVKVVFSRILEAVGRPSAAAAHRARMASPAVRVRGLS